MNKTRARHTLFGMLLVATIGATGCSAESADTGAPPSRAAADDKGPAAGPTMPSKPSGSTEVVQVEGYPLDRTLTGLLSMPDVDTIVVVKGTKLGEAQLLRSTSHEGWDSFPDYIVTPIDARVDSVLRGTVDVRDTIRLIIGGGKVGDLEVIAAPEIAPDPKDIAQYSRLVVAGKTISLDGLGQVLDVYFAYGVNGEGRVKSLMDSASTEQAVFSLDELRTRLAQQRQR